MGRRVFLPSENSEVSEEGDDVIRSNGSLRRLRGRHYAAQRFQDDSLPLIDHLPLPQASYQPHQLIAVCFNHMAGRDCEHCRQIDRSLNTERAHRSTDSNQTFGSRHSRGNSLADISIEKPRDGGEKCGDPGPPPPVGFWNKKLGKLRLECMGLWARTSESTTP